MRNQPTRYLRKIVGTLFLSQSFYSAAMIMSFTVGAILVVQLANGDSRWTGAPTTMRLIGAAVFAYPVGRLMDRIGRRWGLSLGHILGVIGSAIAGVATIWTSLGLLLVGVFIMGLAKGTLDMGRYAAAEASPLERRGRSVSIVVLGATFGSIFGPSFLSFTNEIGRRIGLPDLAGPWFGGSIFFLISLFITFAGLNPDPKVIARDLRDEQSERKGDEKDGRSFKTLFQDSRTGLAVAAMVFGQLAMVLVMTITPVHMSLSGDEIGAISGVILAHTLGMFGFSFLTGWMIDKLGRAKMIIFGGLILTIACVFSPMREGVTWLAGSLFLLGLGWNFCFVAGSTLLDDVLLPHEKGKIQGTTEALINVAAGVGSVGSGFAFSSIGFSGMSWGTALIAIIPLLWAIRWSLRQRAFVLEKIH